eukprot:CAMPEP_0197862258 /NCGR_PEP_ID=MMETSP1438-20131217/38905_1 /TAXON_ID=1461541 /ORGANISM="Pterosperma sp., Strain CCMP1384" /LENGTH=437 /DNA_ID=CAMNT_0043479767 /DNA_START=315 /DNA_END=1628 /DNA_ORIENTATION=+
MAVTCPQCHQVSQGYLGTVVACPFCQAHMQIPHAQPHQQNHPPPPQTHAPLRKHPGMAGEQLHQQHIPSQQQSNQPWHPGQTPVGMHPAAYHSPQPQPPPKLTGRKKALLVGINYFGTSAELRGCLADVRRMKTYLCSNGFRETPTEMVVLTDDQHDPRFQPTRQNICNAMHWLTAGATPGDILFFHFSGHGAQQEDPEGAEEDGMDETIVPVDFKQNGQITDDEIFMHLVWPLPSGVRLTAVMDCCHSGTGMDLPFSWTHRGWMEDTNPFHSQGDVQLFSGCEDDQCSADSTSYGRSGGAMTTAFIEVLRQNPHQNYPSLLNSLHQSLSRHGFNQRPVLSVSQAFDPNRPFSLEDIHPNMNPEVGRKFRKRKHPRRQFGGGLDTMLMAAGVGMVAMAAAPLVFDAVGAGVGAVGDVLGGMDDAGDRAFGFLGDLFG